MDANGDEPGYMGNQETIAKNHSSVMQRISTAARACGRDPQSIQLVAAAKGQPAPLVREALDTGVGIVGENYIQEAQAKFEILSDPSIRWHFIGRLQSNKAKYAVRMFELIHSVDSVKLAAELDKQARKAGKTQQILVQVNISREPSKAGVGQEQALELIRSILTFSNIRVQGLMTMPPYFDAPERARPYFAALRRLRDQAQQDLGIPLKNLSMGMTGDFEVAIQEGATLVRIGTAIFGVRR
jgi:pyridoxal phosphate enzyme (YggS family)